MGFRFVQKSMTLNDLERSKCMCSHRNKNAQRSAHVSYTDVLVCLLCVEVLNHFSYSLGTCSCVFYFKMQSKSV